MKKLGVIRTTQRTAIGDDDSGNTKIYIYQGFHGAEDIHIASELYKGYYTPIGYYEIIHPYVMAGTWEENVGAMCRAVERHMQQADLLEYNDCGTPFLKDGVTL